MIAVLHSNSGPRTLELSPKKILKKFSFPNLCVTTKYGECVSGQYNHLQIRCAGEGRTPSTVLFCWILF